MTQKSRDGSMRATRMRPTLSALWARALPLVLGCLLFPACGPSDPTADEDGDGLTTIEDCDDGDASIGARYADLDGDGYGSGDPLAGCEDLSAAGFSALGGDCDEADAAAHPGAVETCDGEDTDCDGAIDEDGTRTWYRDADGDGFGDAALIRQDCAQPLNYVTDDTDCDDGEATIYPDADELCDFLDNDCNGQTDEGLETDAFYADTDADGYGDPEESLEACAAPDGYVENDADCDDEKIELSPAEPELCDTIDNNCDGEVDEAPEFNYYRDQDGDGYGSGAPQVSCTGAPVGYVDEGGDCNEADPYTSPGIDEQCEDGEDNDCDGATDEERVDQNFFKDTDGDGYGNPTQKKVACKKPDGFVFDNRDCNDNDASVHPGAAEVRGDSLDSNCNGFKDIIAAYAGTGTPGYAGDGAAATSADLWGPSSLAVDSLGNVYIADTSNHRVRRVDAASGIITTVAGNGQTSGQRGNIGDNGPATAGMIERPYGVAIDDLDNLYIADTFHQRIRKVDARTGIITTVAGNGLDGNQGDGGPAVDARLSYPGAVAVNLRGELAIADTGNHKIRLVDPNGMIDTVAGTGTAGYGGDSGPAIAAELNYPYGVDIDDAGNLYIADTFNHRIRKVKLDGKIYTVAGNGTAGYAGDGGTATGAQLSSPTGVDALEDGTFYFADWDNDVIRFVGTDGKIATVAGDGTYEDTGDGGQATAAQMRTPSGVAVDAYGILFIADTGNNRVRVVWW